MNTTNPLVSIIVRTKDRPKLLKEALTSLVKQIYPKIEVIIINDGGDCVKEIVDNFSSELNIILLNHKTNFGRSAAGNTGLAKATGSMIGFLDDDDLFYPNHISTLVNALKKHHNIDLVYSDCQKREHYKFKFGVPVYLSKRKKLFHGTDFDKNKLYRGNYIPLISALFRKELLIKSGPFDKEFDVFEDWDLWLRMSKFSEFKRIAVTTCEYRIFGKRDYDHLEGQIKIFEKYRSLYTTEQLIIWLYEVQSENYQLKKRIDGYIGFEKNDLIRSIQKILTLNTS